MIKRALVSVLSACAILNAASAASPAATQAWVIRYVAEHGGGGGSTNGVSESWVKGYVSSNATTEAWVRDYVNKNGGGSYAGYSAPASNTVPGVISMFRLAAVRSQNSATNDAWRTLSSVTNLDFLVLAPVAPNLFTNAHSQCYMSLTNGILDLHDGAVSYVSGTNLTGYVSLTSSTGGVVRVLASKVSDDEINRAKGE